MLHKPSCHATCSPLYTKETMVEIMQKMNAVNGKEHVRDKEVNVERSTVGVEAQQNRTHDR